MSTNKTENYQLHAWALEDDFLTSEMNENFAALDAAVKAEATAADQAVQAEAAARAQQVGALSDAVTQKEAAEAVLTLTATGFRVYYAKFSSSHYSYSNYNGFTLHYLALR